MSKKYKIAQTVPDVPLAPIDAMKTATNPAPFKNSFEQDKAIDKWLKDTKQTDQWNTKSFPLHCDHRAQCVLKGDKWEVHCGTGSCIRGKAGQFDLLVNCSNGGRYAPRHVIPIKLGDGTRNYTKTPDEIQIEWHDYDVPSLDVQFWYDLYAYIVEHNARALVFCAGGHGRTGTAMACLLVASGYTAKEAIDIVRKDYCKLAIETKLQEQYVHEVAEAGNAN